MIQCINCRGEVSASHFPIVRRNDDARLWLIELLASPRLDGCVIGPAPRRGAVVWGGRNRSGSALAASLRDLGASSRDIIAFHGDAKVARLAARMATIEGLIAGTLDV